MELVKEIEQKPIFDKKEYNKLYYTKNKEKTAQQLYQKIHCSCCNSIVTYQNMSKHLKTKKCYNIKNKITKYIPAKEDESILSVLNSIQYELTLIKNKI
jgi:hypothetical protein